MILQGRRRLGATFLEGAVLLLCIPLVSPLGWDYTLIMALPALMIVVQHFRFFSTVWRAALAIDLSVVAVTVYDVMGARLYESYMAWSIPTLSFLILFAACAVLRTRRLC
jgi:hypothetical protein